MSDIKERIAKCLSLANSPEQEEAKAALLTARKLMAKYKLSMEEIQEKESQKLINQLVNAHYTMMTDVWAGSLAKIVATHHCCATYSSKESTKTYTVAFIGLEDDFRICQQVYMYAYSFIKDKSALLVNNMCIGNTEKRMIKNSYGVGFCAGLKAAYEEQDEKNGEWGLVLATPEQVKNSLNGMKIIKHDIGKHTDRGSDLIHRGYKDGKSFSINKKLECI